jgi:hypothetical protein
MAEEKPSLFQQELADLINRHSREGMSNTPDFLLAEFLENALMAFELTVLKRDRWYLNGQVLEPAQTPRDRAEWLRKIEEGEEGKT